MSLDWMFTFEGMQLLMSIAAFSFSVLVLLDARADLRDTRAPDAALTPEAVLIAKERMITALFLFCMAAFFMVSGAYALALTDATAAAVDAFGQTSLAWQALALRLVLRTGLLGFAFTRWAARERIRRGVHLD